MTSLLETLRHELRKEAIPSKAAGMQAYMKSEMPYHGVPMPRVRTICRRIFTEHSIVNFDDWKLDVLSLWNHAQYREERYAAIALTGDKRAKAFQTIKALPIYETLIVTGAWWDYVDEIAGHRLGSLLENEPQKMKKKMLAWSQDDNFWKRRSSILCQLFFKEETDLDLLYACIQPSFSSNEFFLRKAIGWALRQYAWVNPKEVIRYVREHKNELSPLSKREALKNIIKNGMIEKIP